MADRVTVYDRFGTPLADLPVAVVREYRSESTIQVSKGDFVIPIDHPKATREILQYNNIIVVQSDAGVPTWTGLIWTPTIVREGQIKVSLRAVEWILGQRFIEELYDFSTSPGAWFQQILYYAQSSEALPIQENYTEIDYGGGDVELNLSNISCYDAANNLANKTGFYWGFKPVLPAIGGSLLLRPFFTLRTGRTFSTPLVQNKNLADVEIQEVGDICNYLNVTARLEGVSEPIYGIATDEKSRGLYGLIEDYDTNVTVATIGGAQTYAESQIQRRRYPYLRIAGTLTSRPFPVAGDKVPVMLSTQTKYLRRNLVIDCRVKTSRYDPVSNSLNVLLEEEPT